MKSRQKGEDPWKYATYEGVERLQYLQTAKMTLSERLEALDDMIRLARGLHMGGKRSQVEKQPPGVPSKVYQHSGMPLKFSHSVDYMDGEVVFKGK